MPSSGIDSRASTAGYLTRRRYFECITDLPGVNFSYRQLMEQPRLTSRTTSKNRNHETRIHNQSKPTPYPLRARNLRPLQLPVMANTASVPHSTRTVKTCYPPYTTQIMQLASLIVVLRMDLQLLLSRIVQAVDRTVDDSTIVRTGKAGWDVGSG